MAEIPVLGLFAGVAGLDLAIRIAIPGARNVGFCERERAGCEILDARIEEGSLDDAPIFTDVRSFPSELYRGRVAGIVAGFPCPDYSVAGKRAGIVGKHGQLWDYTAAVIRDVGPDWVFLENVPGIYVPHGGDAGAVLPAGLWFVLGDLATLGFDAEWICIRASDAGASHGRARWFCLAYKPGGRLGILRESPGSDGFTDGSHEELAYTPRHERAGSYREAGPRRGVCETGNGVDDAELSQRWPLGECGRGGGEGIDGRRQAPGGTGIPIEALERERVGSWECDEHGRFPAYEYRGDVRYLRSDGDWMLIPGECPECGSGGDCITYDPEHGGAVVNNFFEALERERVGSWECDEHGRFPAYEYRGDVRYLPGRRRLDAHTRRMSRVRKRRRLHHLRPRAWRGSCQ